MPVPDFQSLMLPALEAFAGGGEPSLSKVRERIAAAEGLSAEDFREKLPSGRQAVFVNRVSWAVIYMERAGLPARVRRGVYRLTLEGERLLSRKPSRIDLNLLGDYPDFAEWSQRANAPPAGKEVASKQSEEISDTPEEALDRAAQQLSSALEADVLHRVRDAAPAFLEQVVVDLLIAMGYGGGDAEMGRAPIVERGSRHSHRCSAIEDRALRSGGILLAPATGSRQRPRGWSWRRRCRWSRIPAPTHHAGDESGRDPGGVDCQRESAHHVVADFVFPGSGFGGADAPGEGGFLGHGRGSLFRPRDGTGRKPL